MAIRISGLNSGLDTDSIVQELVSAYRTKGEKYEKQQTKISWKQDAWKSLSSKIYSFRSGLDKMRFSSNYNLKTTSVSNSTKAKITAGNNAVNGTQTLEVKQLATTAYTTGEEIKTLTGWDVTSNSTLGNIGFSGAGEISVNGKRMAIDDSMTINDVVKRMSNAGVNVTFDESSQRFFISATESGKAGDFTIAGLDEKGVQALTKLGLNTESADAFTTDATDYGTKTDAELEDVLKSYSGKDVRLANLTKEYQAAKDDATRSAVVNEFKELIAYGKDIQTSPDTYKYNEGAVSISGHDAEIKLNGATFTSTSNTFSINGLTIETLGTTEAGEVLSITTSTDTQGIYDKIKDFISDYNDLINEMTKSYNAESASDYEPLTDDEKDAMSESEIEKWEAKGKGAILRRDSTLSTLMSVMTNAMAKSYTINGKNYALSTFGIMTLGIMNAEDNEQNAYHIDGDSDDDSTSSNTDKLMAAIVADPEGVTEFFKQLSNDLYSSLGEHMTSTSLRSYGSFYNDKELESQYKSYTTKISNWETKVEELEERYYKQFSKMETALAELESQQSSLSGLLG